MKVSLLLLPALLFGSAVSMLAQEDTQAPPAYGSQPPPSYGTQAPPANGAPPPQYGTPPPYSNQAPPPGYSSAPPPAQAPPPAGREWVPESVYALGQYATSRTEFTLDHSMLVLASKLDQDNADLRRVIAGINGVSVHSFHYPGPVPLDPGLMGSISQQYREAGWQHLVNKHRNADGNGTTDLWLRMDHAAISDIAVLWITPKQANFVSVSGSIAPLDLLHLSGHFGIPRMDGGVAVPVPPDNGHAGYR